MIPGLVVERLALLAAVALLGGVVALAVGERRAENARALTGAPAPAGWNNAFAGSRGPAGDAQRTSCGQILAPGSLGITQPVLPCGTKLVLKNGDALVLSEVIDNVLTDPGHQLEVTEKLAKVLGLQGTQELQWRFATPESG